MKSLTAAPKTTGTTVRQYWRQIVLLSVWALLLIGGFGQLFIYANTPGALSLRPPQRWPAETSLLRDPHLPTLVIFAYPLCPCSEASIGELERLLPYIQGKVKSFVIFFKPKSQSENWAKEALWKKALAIPEVQVFLDEDGIVANQFDAKTSGQTFLYDSKGDLVFSGGITPERGHMGDSQGRSAILAFVETEKTPISKTRVFGCSLKNPERAIAGSTK